MVVAEQESVAGSALNPVSFCGVMSWSPLPGLTLKICTTRALLRRHREMSLGGVKVCLEPLQQGWPPVTCLAQNP